MKKKYSKELFKKWMEPDKELDKRLKEENEGKRSFFQAAWHGSNFSNIPAVNMVIKILLAIFILWLFLFTGIGDFLRS